jgi:acetyltransferase-like isoleucine patch superfamily enzyme
MSTARILPRYPVGPSTYGRPTVLDFGQGASLRIGDYTSIGGDVVVLLGGEHGADVISTYPFAFLWPEGKSLPPQRRTKGDVRIGNDVWIGQRVTILSGVAIGDGAVIGAGSVVTRDVPAYAVAAGNPCRILRMRFDCETIEMLQSLRWWDWPRELVVEALPILAARDVSLLLRFAEANGRAPVGARRRAAE